MYVITAKFNPESDKIKRDENFVVSLIDDGTSMEDFFKDPERYSKKSWIVSRDKSDKRVKQEMSPMFPVVFAIKTESDNCYYPCSDKVIRFIEK